MKKATYLIVVFFLVVSAFLVGKKYGLREDAGTGDLPSSPAGTEEIQQGGVLPEPPPGAVEITPERQQLIGLRIAKAEKKQVSHTLRILGRVAVDERKVYIINSAATGWVREVSPVTVGSLVKKGEKLATFYSPEFLSAEQAYFYALNALDRFMESPNPDQIVLTKSNIRQYGDSLRNLGMGEKQIEEIGRTRTFVDQIEMASPTDGIIISRNIYVGQRFEKATEFFKITDLSRVWILADVYENEGRYLKPGIKARITLPQMKKTYTATVSNVPPVFDPQTRTLKVRLEADNPGEIMRPDMFADIELSVTTQPALAVPSDAIIFSGLKRTVFVDLGNGYFEPREVQTGWRLGNKVEITKGLKPGERIVVSGNFLVDSESKLRGAGLGSTQSDVPEAGTDSNR